MNPIILPRPLRLVLGLDAAASGAVALALVLGHRPLSPLLGLPEGLLLGSGLFLVLWSLSLAVLARRGQVRPSWVWTVVALNVVWGAESIAALALGWLQPTALGEALLVAQAVGVLVLADLQGWFLWRRPAAGRLAAA